MDVESNIDREATVDNLQKLKNLTMYLNDGNLDETEMKLANEILTDNFLTSLNSLKKNNPADYGEFVQKLWKFLETHNLQSEDEIMKKLGKLALPSFSDVGGNITNTGTIESKVEKVAWADFSSFDGYKAVMELNDTRWQYNVEFDSEWKLKPIAINTKSGVKVLLKNVPSCAMYLSNKLPRDEKGNVAIEGAPTIGWNSRVNDYVITSFGKSLTIEPMTINWEWIWNLQQSLALLNFTNYLRWAWGIDNLQFENDNPDLKLVRDKKSRDLKFYVKLKKWQERWKEGKWEEEWRDWYPIPMERFWLNGIVERDLEKFKSYNNGEKWNYNLDKERNNNYVKIDVVDWSVREPVKASAQQTYQNGENTKRDVNRETNSPQAVSLKLVSDFQFGKFWIRGNDGDGIKVFESGGGDNNSYYWSENGKVCKLEYPYCVKQEAILSDGQTFDDNKLPQGLNFTPENKLYVCEQWAAELTSEIKNVYKGIKEKDTDLDAEVVVTDSNYVLQWPKDSWEKNKISLDNLVGSDGKIFGYEINKPDEWLKVILFLKENYDLINWGKSINVSEDDAEKYGVTVNNLEAINSFLWDSDDKLKIVSIGSSTSTQWPST